MKGKSNKCEISQLIYYQSFYDFTRKSKMIYPELCDQLLIMIALSSWQDVLIILPRLLCHVFHDIIRSIEVAVLFVYRSCKFGPLNDALKSEEATTKRPSSFRVLLYLIQFLIDIFVIRRVYHEGRVAHQRPLSITINMVCSTTFEIKYASFE